MHTGRTHVLCNTRTATVLWTTGVVLFTLLLRSALAQCPVCGNGICEAGEACDDGNTVYGDGCSGTCLTIGTGWTCTGCPSVCTPICGDGLVVGSEQCDDGNTNSFDGCSPTCQMELPAGCIPTSASAYLTAFGNDARFQRLLQRAATLGYQTTLGDSIRCTPPGGTEVIYLSVLYKVSDPNAFILIRSRSDLPEPFRTAIYSSSAPGVLDFLFDTGGFRTNTQAGQAGLVLTNIAGQPFLYDQSSDTVPPGCPQRTSGALLCFAGTLAVDAVAAYACRDEWVTCGSGLLWTLPLGKRYYYVLTAGCVAVREFSSPSPGPCYSLLTQPIPGIGSGIDWAQCAESDAGGKECILPGTCTKGVCTSFDGGSGWQCVATNPPQSACIVPCEQCGTHGCENAATICCQCQPDGSCTALVSDPLVPKWGKVTSDNGGENPCVCGAGGCGCGAAWGVQAHFYNCANPPVVQPVDVGNYTGSSMGSASQLPSCVTPPSCSASFQQQLAYVNFNICQGAGQGHNHCNSPAPASSFRVPYTVNLPFDLRADVDKRARCCAVHP
jgi:cysteine-rich repeat protein